MRCINCGAENDNIICGECRKNTDTEKLCNDLLDYIPYYGGNKLWDSVASELSTTENFGQVVFALSDELPSPLKEFYKIESIARKQEQVPKPSREWLYEMYESLKESSLDEFRLNRVRGLVLNALSSDYRYEEAEEIAELLCSYDKLPYQCSYTLQEYYIITRRYDKASELIQKQLDTEENPDLAKKKLISRLDEISDRRSGRKKKYVPANKNGRQKYREFMSSLGIEVELTQKEKEAAAGKYQPDPSEITNADFDTFVAYDLETTGCESYANIIEIGAIKVVNGVVCEEKQFEFQELVRLQDRSKLRSEVKELTGITEDDLRDARKLEDVLKDFIDFIGDNILIGFNNISFDAPKLLRAVRKYGNQQFGELYKQFDVMKFATRLKDQIGSDGNTSLEKLCQKLGVENKQAHRALSDAVATAKVFIKLKEFNVGDGSLDDLISDVDLW